MKKMFVVFAAVLAMAFISCSNSSNSGIGDVTNTIFSGTTWKCIDSGGDVDMLYVFSATGNNVTRKYTAIMEETTAYTYEAPWTAKIAAGTFTGAEDFVIDANDQTKATGANGLLHFVKQ